MKHIGGLWFLIASLFPAGGVGIDGALHFGVNKTF
jgi:hypothetical protein